MRLVELSRSEHAGLRIRQDRVEATASDQHLVPVVVSEFRKAAIQYPIVFAKHPETGRFAPYVLNGLAVKENLFWTGTELDVAYVPLNVRRQPFYAPENVLCIDLDSPCVDPSGQKTLVNPDGSDSSFLKGMLSVLGELVAGKTATEQTARRGRDRRALEERPARAGLCGPARQWPDLQAHPAEEPTHRAQPRLAQQRRLISRVQ